MSNEKWMPPKPKFQELYNGYSLGTGATYAILPKGSLPTPVAEVLMKESFDKWYDKEIRPLFENATTLLSEDGCAKGLWDYEYEDYCRDATHQALLIKIEPIKEPDPVEDMINRLDREIKLTSKITDSLYIEKLFKEMKSLLEKIKENG